MIASDSSSSKDAVHDFWNRASCGELYSEGQTPREQLESQARIRYELEPYLPEFARFADGAAARRARDRGRDGGRSSRVGQVGPSVAHRG